MPAKYPPSVPRGVVLDTLGALATLGYGVTAHCGCGASYGLDMTTLVWTRGAAFPPDLLASRLRCPICHGINVQIRLQPWTRPTLPQPVPMTDAKKGGSLKTLGRISASSSFRRGFMPMFYASSPAREVSYLFIDGGSFQETLRAAGEKYFGEHEPEINYANLRAEHRKAFFYDAVPVRLDGEGAEAYEVRTAAKLEYLNNIARQDGFHVRSGDARRRRRVGLEQKMVDVQLAVDMMSYASQGVFSNATLLTSDLNFKPLIDALVDMGINVNLTYRLGHTNDDLITAADKASPANIVTLNGWFTEKFRKENPLPYSGHVFPEGQLPGPLVRSWQDSQYGDCKICQVGNGFRLTTGLVTPTHCLQVSFENLTTLRLYVEEVYGLAVPEIRSP